MRRVLHLISTAGPGGAETVYRDLVLNLGSGGWDVVPVVPWEDWLTDQLRSAGFEPVVAASRSRYDLAYLTGLARLARERSVDLIHAHLFGPAVEASIAGLMARVPVVCTIHGRGDLRPDEKLRALKFSILNRGLSRLVFVSESLRDYYLQQGPLRADRTTVIPNGADLGAARSAGDGARLRPSMARPGRFLVGSVGNLREVKRYDVLIRAAALLRQRSDDFDFVIAGQAPSPLLDELRALAAELGVTDSVHFLGFTDDVHSLLASVDLFALTSDSEGFSIATVQAMAHGLPIVATRCGGPEEILNDGVTGLLVDRGSEHQLADAIAGLRDDAQRREALGLAARAAAEERYTLQAQVRSYLTLYDEVIHHRTRRNSRGSTLAGAPAADTQG